MACQYKFVPNSISIWFQYFETSIVWGNMVLRTGRNTMQSTEFQATFEAMICKVAQEAYNTGRNDIKKELKETLGIR